MRNAPELPARPTIARYGVLFFLCTLAFLLYIDRVCIGQAEKDIRESLDLTKEDMSWVYNAFIVAYCLFEVPTGHWGDRFGSRGVIARIVLWWSAFTALTGAATGLWSLVAMRFLFGAGEAGAFPNAARVVTRWFPAAERGRARAAITMTSLIGGAIAPPLAAYLIGLAGWRWTFASFGLLGVIWTAVFYYWFRDNPAKHTSVNAAELERIGVAEQHATSPQLPIPWKQAIASPNVWLMGTIMAVSSALFYMQFQWYPTYLKEARGLSDQRAGTLTGVVIIGGALGCLAGGWLADLIIRRTTERRWTRRLCGGVMLLLAAASLAGVRFSERAELATACNAAALFFLQVSIPMWWTVVAEISGEHGASMWGLMNSIGGLGVFVMNWLVGRVVEARQQADFSPLESWRPVFDGVAIALTVGAVCWLFVDATRPIVRRNTDSA